MAQQNKGLYTRILEGNEKNTECTRTALPKSRYQLFKDIFTGKFGKVVKINLLTILFFLPMLVLLFLSSLYSQTNALIYPFGANLGVGYPAKPNLQGMAECLSFESGLFTCLAVAMTSILASVGLAGGMYAIRNMIWTEGEFAMKDFWRGVKLNYKNALQSALFFSVTLMVMLALINLAEFNLALTVGSGRVWLRISQVISYILISLSAMMTLWMIALGVNYQMGFLTLIKNSFLLSIGTIFQTVFFGVVALLPFALLVIGGMGSLFFTFGLGCLIFFSFSFALLVWLSFAQWVFDKYINPKIKHVKKAEDKKENKSTGKGEGVAEKKSRLLSKPIKPLDDGAEVYDLPQAFTRADLKKRKENRESIANDLEAYEQETKYEEKK